jgi:hypothetical protein
VRDEPEDQDQTADPAPARGLTPLERWIASITGLAGVAAGGVGVFLSDNQAGTTAILLLGAVFLLMGVQGTAIIKAGKDSVEMERRWQANKLAKRAEELVRDNKPDAAAELAAAAAQVDPRMGDSQRLRRLNKTIYCYQALEALQRASQEMNVTVDLFKDSFDTVDSPTPVIEALFHRPTGGILGRRQGGACADK